MKNYFDIETGPLSAAALELVKPTFTANKTLKDPEKIKVDLADKEKDWKDRAALDALTGEILCIGIGGGLGSIRLIEGSEKEILKSFWPWLEQELHAENDCIGFNIFGFDLPFLMRRSWQLQVPVPAVVRRKRYWNDCLIDIMDIWCLGNRDQRISLDNMSKAFGVGKKNGEGKDFAMLYRHPLEEKRHEAILYLKNDIELLRRCADRILGGPWNPPTVSSQQTTNER